MTKNTQTASVIYQLSGATWGHIEIPKGTTVVSSKDADDGIAVLLSNGNTVHLPYDEMERDVEYNSSDILDVDYSS